MYKKRGLSSIIATVLLVLLTFVAVVIIAGFIIPLVRDGLDEGTECFPYQDYLYFNEDTGYNCLQEDGGQLLYAVSIGTNSVGEEDADKMSGFKLLFMASSGETKAVLIKGGGDDWGANVGKIRRVNVSLPLEIPGSGEVRTYVYNATERFDSVKVAPYLESGKTCSESDSISLAGINCGSSKELTVD